MYSGYQRAFDGEGEWYFSNNVAWNIVILGVDNSSSSHTDNRKNDFLVLDEGDTFGINGNFGTSEKLFIITFSKSKTKFCMSLHYKDDNSYFFVKKSLK